MSLIMLASARMAQTKGIAAAKEHCLWTRGRRSPKRIDHVSTSGDDAWIGAVVLARHLRRTTGTSNASSRIRYPPLPV